MNDNGYYVRYAYGHPYQDKKGFFIFQLLIFSWFFKLLPQTASVNTTLGGFLGGFLMVMGGKNVDPAHHKIENSEKLSKIDKYFMMHI